MPTKRAKAKELSPFNGNVFLISFLVKRKEKDRFDQSINRLELYTIRDMKYK